LTPDPVAEGDAAPDLSEKKVFLKAFSWLVVVFENVF